MTQNELMFAHQPVMYNSLLQKGKPKTCLLLICDKRVTRQKLSKRMKKFDTITRPAQSVPRPDSPCRAGIPGVHASIDFPARYDARNVRTASSGGQENLTRGPVVPTPRVTNNRESSLVKLP